MDRFEAFVRTHQDMVYATALRLLGREADAEDVAQTVFLRAYERFDRIGSSPAAAGWLKTVTTNVCLNHLSRYRSRWRFFSELVRSGAPADSAAFETTIRHEGDAPDVELERAEEYADLGRALGELPAHQRVPLVLFHFDRMSYQEIAARLRVSLAKVKTDVHRGREALRARLRDRR